MLSKAGRQEEECSPDEALIAKEMWGKAPAGGEKRKPETHTSSSSRSDKPAKLPASTAVTTVCPVLAAFDALCSAFINLSRGELLEVDILVSPISWMRKGANRRGEERGITVPKTHSGKWDAHPC